MLPSATGAAALARAYVIREAIRQMRLEHAGQRLSTVTSSAGTAAMLESSDDIGAALARAAQALCTAKDAGRNRIVLAEPPGK